MKYSYPIINGSVIEFKDLKLTRAKDIAHVIFNHPYCLENSISLRGREDEAEIILATFDIEISQFPKNGIQPYEDIAIICTINDNTFPEIYALREDFKNGLPHTILQTFEHPVCLCVTEQLFCEVKHRFNTFDFIESIRQWLTQTADNNLHQEDQPLEPFFNINSGVVISHDYDKNKVGYLHRPEGSALYRLNNNPSQNQPYYLIAHITDPQTHGFIRKLPKCLNDLSDVIRIKNETITDYIKKEFEKEVKMGMQNKIFQRLFYAFYFIVPVKRNIDDIEPSSFERFVVFLKKNFEQIGIESSCLERNNDKLVPVIGKQFETDVINTIPIEIHYVMDDFTSDSASLYNDIEINKRKYTIIGAGALGSQVLELFARIGYGRWFLIDNDNLFPHNLAKHILGRNDIGFNKAAKVEEKLNDLLGIDFINAINENFLSNDKELLPKLKETEAIVDMSTSIAVARKLSRDYQEKIKAPRISCFLNPMGTDLIILAEDKKRQHRLDFLEIQYYRCLYQEKSLHDHLKYTDSLKVRYNRNSCREITNRINQTDVAIHSSICAKALKNIFENGNSSINIWRINNQTYEVRKLTFSPSKWIRININEWKVYIDKWLVEKIEKFRNDRLPVETGGVLLGSIDSQRNIIYIGDSIIAPTDSIERKESFERGIEGLIDKYKKYLQVTDFQFQYLGEWHSHPDGHSVKPSGYDKKLYEYLYKKMYRQGLPVLMGIFGDTNFSLIFKNYNYEF